MKSYLQPGDVLTLNAPYDRVGGEGALVGAIFGVATGAVASGSPGEFSLVGVFDLKKTSAQAWTVGARVYWDDTAKECTSNDDEGANPLIGIATEAAANPTAAGRVRLNASF